MDNLNQELLLLKKTIDEKNTKIKEHQNCITALENDIYDIQNSREILIDQFIKENKSSILQEHPHYKEHHNLVIKTTYYYDTDWFRDTYGTRNPVDSYGFPLEYEGPDRLIYVICKECNISIQKPEKNIKSEIELGEEIFQNKILKNFRKRLLL